MKVLAALTLALAISYVRADGAHSHEHAPVADAYGPPADTYGPPEPVYDPPTSYDAPVTYEHHDVYEPEPIFDITPIIVAILVLVGLSLLFPTHVRVTAAGRKKRYAEEIIERSDFAGRTMEIYEHLNMALEPIDRGCLEKITCEVGGLAYDAGVTSSPFLKLLVPFVPGKYEKYVKHFVYAENCHKIKCSAYP